nr:hypothetical protein CFP56_24456 [Quercus suber]
MTKARQIIESAPTKKKQLRSQFVPDMPLPNHRAPPKSTLPSGTAAAGPPANKIRVYILTAAFTAITATGAWYGAGLKADQEAKQVHHLPYASLYSDSY